jgi:hypothetical protein
MGCGFSVIVDKVPFIEVSHPGKDSRRIVTDARALALEVGQDSSSVPLPDGLDLKLGQLIGGGAQPTRSASMT